MNYLTILKTLQDYYSNLLIVQYNGKEKAIATISLMTWLTFSCMLLLQIRDTFDWKTAIGKQLDIIGKWVGVSRAYNGSLFWDATYLSYPEQQNLTPTDNTDTLQHGYSDYDNFDTDTGNTLTYNNLQFVTQDLSDDDYRLIIGLKIIKNNINHTAKNIDDAIWNYFNGQVYTTWTQDTITYNYPASLDTIMNICNYKGVLLAPTGITIALREI